MTTDSAQTSVRGPRLRDSLASLPTYKAGRAAQPVHGRPAYKLSSNENPYPPLPSVLAKIAEAAAAANRYPDIMATELTNAIASRFDVPPTHVTTGTGSVGVLQQVIEAAAGAGDEVVYAWRSFEAYPILVQVAGATSVPVPLTSTEKHDLDAMRAAITDRTRLVLVCTPNNPTGPAIRRERLTEFLDSVPSDVLVVIDEAYREFVRDPRVADGIELYRDRPNVAVLRTFSKAYGLAGLRVGFGIAHEPVATALRQCALPFGVSTIAQIAAVASLAAEDELLERVDALVAERERVRDTLRGQGWPVPPTEANFVWLRLGDRTHEFSVACREAGVVVRPFGDEGARCTIGETEANDLLLGVAARFAPA